jgi:hypothetical protein
MVATPVMMLVSSSRAITSQKNDVGFVVSRRDGKWGGVAGEWIMTLNGRPPNDAGFD